MEKFTRKPITLICVQPCILYYAWQIEVMLTNFKELGLEKHFDIHCLFAYNKTESDWQKKVQTIQKVENNLKSVAQFFYYEDTRKYPISYISSIRPNVLKQHFYALPYLKEDTIFYHDCDIVFTKFPDFLPRLIQNDVNWYVSDTISYIGSEYIISKGEDVIDKMCEIVGINKELVKRKEYQSGGAQYVMKGCDWQFFNKMEIDSEMLFKEITNLNIEKKRLDPTHHELQIWCADMWALLWGAWMRGYHTNVIPELSFCWATDNIENWEKKYIFHNAGVTSDAKHLFNKTDFRDSLPYELNNTFDKNSASSKYFEIIKSVGINSCLYVSKNETI